MPANLSLNQIAALGVVLTPIIWTALGNWVHRYLVTKLTILNDIPDLGKPGKRGKHKLRGTAVICGGSVAGLWAARVCADHFEKVVVIEPETWIAHSQDSDPEDYVVVKTREQEGTQSVVNQRTRVRQYHAIHAFQPLPVLAFRKLFPNFDAEAQAMGIDVSPSELHVVVSGIPIQSPIWSYPDGKLPDSVGATRASFETLLRKLVTTSDACKNVEFITGTVTGVVPSVTGPNRLEGVQVRMEGQTDARVVSGELIVDCTGPTQGFFKWLTRAGYGSPGPSPKEKKLADLRLEYEQRMKYSCFQFTLTPEMKAQLSATYPPDPSKGSHELREGWDNAAWLFAASPIAEVDNKVVMGRKMERGDGVELAFGGWAVDNPPRTKGEIMEFMDSLVLVPGREIPKWIPNLLEFLVDDHPGAPKPIVSIYPSPSSAWVQYHLASNLPSNFVATGDAIMELNPIFGQGCSKACIGAVTLDTHLKSVQGDSIPDNFGKGFFQKQDARLSRFWDQAKDQDYRFETTKPLEGEEKRMEKMLQAGGDFGSKFKLAIIKLAVDDRDVAHTLWHVSQMLAPATDMIAPWLVVRLAWAKLRGVV